MEEYKLRYKGRVYDSPYKSVQKLLDFLESSDEYNYAGYIMFENGVKIKGVMNESHFQCVFGIHAKKCFFIGRGQDTWDGIYNFGGRKYGNHDPVPMMNPDDPENELLYILPKPH